MNKWVVRSIKLANSEGYLDKLFNIYPVEMGLVRDISAEIKNEIGNAFKNKNEKKLIEGLLKFPKFPVDDPYIASLRRHSYLLDKNPKTIKRIGKKLLAIDIDVIIGLATKPKSPSRQFGNSFRNWLRGLKIPFSKEKELNNYKVAFLDESDNKLKQFALKELGLKGLKRRPDFILKAKNKFIIGEAKFLTDYGGTQNNQFDGALKMAKIKKNNILGIAVLDGIVWFESNSYMHRTIKKISGVTLSSLLLKEFIDDLLS